MSTTDEPTPPVRAPAGPRRTTRPKGERWALRKRSRRSLEIDAAALSHTAENGSGFETEEMVRAEDRIRVKGLRLSRPVPGRMGWTNMGVRLRLLGQLPFPQPFPPRRVDAYDRLQSKLEGQGAALISTSLASSVTMRIIRQTVIGALLAAFASYSDEELATATVINRRWTYSVIALNAVTALKLKNRFRADLNRIGLTKMPGPFIAFLHGEFEPRRGIFVLHFHILTTRAKAEVLRRLKRFPGYTRTASGAVPIKVKPVRDRVTQFSYLLKAYWPARAIRTFNGVEKRDRRGRRIPEPFATQVLLWLDRQRLRDLTIMNDCWSRRSGGPEVMKRLYLSVMGAW